MTTWNPHTELPTAPETAIVAVDQGDVYPDAPGPFLLDEVYRFDVRYQRWIGETSGLLLKHARFWWMREDDLLASLPR